MFTLFSDDGLVSYGGKLFDILIFEYGVEFKFLSSCILGYTESHNDDIEIVVPDHGYGLHVIDILDPSFVSSKITYIVILLLIRQFFFYFFFFCFSKKRLYSLITYRIDL